AHVPEPKYGIVRHIYVAETDASLCTKPGLPLPTSSPTLITCAWCRVTLVAGQRTWPILTLAGRRDCTSWGRRTLSSSRCRSTYRSPARTILSAPFASARLLARKYCTPCDCVGSFEPPFPCRLDTAQFNGPLPCVCSR